jgi:hypothetical protein
MVTCPACGSIVFVDMEGAAHVATNEAASVQPETGGGDAFAAIPEMPAIDSTDEFVAVEAASVGQDLDPASSHEPMGIEPFAAPAAEPISESTKDFGEMDMNAFLGYEPDPAQVAAKAAAEAARASQNDPNDPLGLSAYANSEMSGAKNGPLVVSVVISGIDAKDLRDEIRQALQDSRFGWDTAALMSGIKSGVLRIDRVSPVKATVLINRIKNLSVRIRWEQSAITEIDPTEKDL